MALATQTKMLRVLQEGEIQRVGGERTVQVDVRVIAATNRDLEKMVDDGTFREDLFYRLNVVSLKVPPLRERRQDIPLLVEHFIRKHGTSEKSPTLSKPVQGFFLEYDFRGNVRELEHAMEHAVIFCDKEITFEHLPDNMQYDAIVDDGKIVYRELRQQAIEKWERNFFTWLLTKTGGKVREAAREANMDLATLSRKLKRYGLRSKETKKLPRNL